jgi:hypothetical protein
VTSNSKGKKVAQDLETMPASVPVLVDLPQGPLGPKRTQHLHPNPEAAVQGPWSTGVSTLPRKYGSHRLLTQPWIQLMPRPNANE